MPRVRIQHPAGVEPVDVLRHLGGTATREQIERYSKRWALEQAVGRKVIEKIGRGMYSLPDLPESLKTAAAMGGTLSHASAADYWLMDAVCRTASVHVTVPRRGHRQAARSVTLHYADLGDADLRDERVTSPLRTVLDCARTMPFREALAIADSALRRELITVYELGAGADAVTGPGSRRARRVAGLADARAANPFESALRASVIHTGVGGFIPQLFIPELGYWVDLGDARRMLVLEADSFAFHGSPAALERDCRRYAELCRKGWMVVRLAWEQVMFEEKWVEEVILDCCRLRTDGRGGTTARNRPSNPLRTD
jgi:very-short-patch-repair endonuclease